MYDEKENLRRRYTRMSWNVLLGYLTVEIFAVLARRMELTSISYLEIAALASVVNLGTLGFILFLKKTGGVSAAKGRAVFVGELLLYLVMYGLATYYLRELRTIALVYAIISTGIELPYTTPRESLAISLGSIVSFLCASVYAVGWAGQAGSVREAFFFSVLFVPPMVLLAVGSKQLRDRDERIRSDHAELRKLNDDLTDKNRLLEKAVRRDRVEMELAGTVQEMILPRQAPPSPEWDAAFLFLPVSRVSGDFYDFYKKDGLLSGLSLFDAAGHGVSAALVTMIIRPVLYQTFTRHGDDDLGAIARLCASTLYGEFAAIGTFATGIMLRFGKGAVEYVNLGHPDPLVRRGATGMVEPVIIGKDSHKGDPVGVESDGLRPRPAFIHLEPGDDLVLYTDGLLSRLAGGNSALGNALLGELVRGAPEDTAERLCAHLLERLPSRAADGDMADDITVIAVKRRR